MTQLIPNKDNQLKKLSCADSYQVKSISNNRFISVIGVVSEDILDEIVSGVAISIGLGLF